MDIINFYNGLTSAQKMHQSSIRITALSEQLRDNEVWVSKMRADLAAHKDVFSAARKAANNGKK